MQVVKSHRDEAFSRKRPCRCEDEGRGHRRRRRGCLRRASGFLSGRGDHPGRVLEEGGGVQGSDAPAALGWVGGGRPRPPPGGATRRGGGRGTDRGERRRRQAEGRRPAPGDLREGGGLGFRLCRGVHGLSGPTAAAQRALEEERLRHERGRGLSWLSPGRWTLWPWWPSRARSRWRSGSERRSRGGARLRGSTAGRTASRGSSPL